MSAVKPSTQLEITINKWDGSAVKNALDDGAKESLKESFGIIETYSLFDGRLIIGTLAVLMAFVAVAYDHLHPYPQSRIVLIICVTSYFIMTTILSAYIMFVEKNIFFVGLERDATGLDPDNTWKLSSTLKKYDDKYSLKLSFFDGKTKTTTSRVLERSISDFFDVNGSLRIDLYSNAIKDLSDSLNISKKLK